MSRRVLITGAGGFVGAHLAEGFVALGDAVTAFDRSVDVPTRRRLKGATLCEAALTTAALEPLGGFDLVIHGAAITTAPDEFGVTALEHIRRNTELLLASLEHAVTTGAKDFVFLSSSGVFAPGVADVLVETTPALARIPYAVAKRAGEVIIEGADRLRAIAVRLGPVYGPHEQSRATRRQVSVVRRWLLAAHDGAPIVVASPDTERDWTFAPDLARAIDALLAQTPPVAGVVHLAAPGSIRDAELARLIAGQGEIVVAPDHLPPRRPMRSTRLDLAALIDWTPLAAGLKRTAELDFAR